MNKKILAGIIIAILIFVVLGFFLGYEGETQVKQGVLIDVAWSVPLNSDDITLILTFSDGEEILVKEGNTEDSQEMYEYLSGWIGQDIIIEYTYEFDIMANELDSVSPAN